MFCGSTKRVEKGERQEANAAMQPIRPTYLKICLPTVRHVVFPEEVCEEPILSVLVLYKDSVDALDVFWVVFLVKHYNPCTPDITCV